jgi:hypothetical protein
MLNILTIRASELVVGDRLYVGGKRVFVDIESIEYAEGFCKGIHVNAVRRETRMMKNKGKIVGLNPDRGSLLYCYGCYNRCAYVEILAREVADTDIAQVG